MEMRYPPHPEAVRRFTTAELRSEFLIENLFEDGKIRLVYSHLDRVIVGGAKPGTQPNPLTGDPKELGADYFLQRRELGVVNVGGHGEIIVDGTCYPMGKLDAL